MMIKTLNTTFGALVALGVWIAVIMLGVLVATGVWNVFMMSGTTAYHLLQP